MRHRLLCCALGLVLIGACSALSLSAGSDRRHSVDDSHGHRKPQAHGDQHELRKQRGHDFKGADAPQAPNSPRAMRMRSPRHRGPVAVASGAKQRSPTGPLRLKRLWAKTPPPPVAAQNLTAEERAVLDARLQLSFGSKPHRSADYRKVVARCGDKGKAVVRFFDASRFLLAPVHRCAGRPDILIAVHTRPSAHARRQSIRNTFGSAQTYLNRRLVLLFFIGRTNSESVQQAINEEYAHYQDIVQKDFVEHYRNMTYKHLSIFEWIASNCPSLKYLVKVDDDVFVNIFQVVSYIDNFGVSTFYCSRTVGPKPMRSRGSKWYLKFEEYPNESFPPYCMGYGYIMNARHAKSLYWCSVFSKYLWIDDVLVGGVLPEKLRLPIQGFLNGHNMAYIMPSHASFRVADHMFLLGIHNELMPDVNARIWRAAVKFSS